ncbi:hypothetical protein Tco_0460414, partial [Tanacetum coccineum]
TPSDIQPSAATQIWGCYRCSEGGVLWRWQRWCRLELEADGGCGRKPAGAASENKRGGGRR